MITVGGSLCNLACHMPGLDPEEHPTFRGTVSFVAAARVTSSADRSCPNPREKYNYVREQFCCFCIFWKGTVWYCLYVLWPETISQYRLWAACFVHVLIVSISSWLCPSPAPAVTKASNWARRKRWCKPPWIEVSKLTSNWCGLTFPVKKKCKIRGQQNSINCDATCSTCETHLIEILEDKCQAVPFELLRHVLIRMTLLTHPAQQMLQVLQGVVSCISTDLSPPTCIEQGTKQGTNVVDLHAMHQHLTRVCVENQSTVVQILCPPSLLSTTPFQVQCSGHKSHTVRYIVLPDAVPTVPRPNPFWNKLHSRKRASGLGVQARIRGDWWTIKVFRCL